MAFFLSTRLVTAAGGSSNTGGEKSNNTNDKDGVGSSVDGDYAEYYGGEEPATRLKRYEGKMAELASEFEDGMVRF